MNKFAIGSKNKAKLKAVQSAIRLLKKDYEIETIVAPSKVSGMPFSDEETITGAVNRAEFCVTNQQGILYGIGLEGGVSESKEGLFLINWGALAEQGQETVIAGGARIKLPEEIAVRLRRGEELGPVMDDYCQRDAIRHGEGAIGIFTNGLVNRDEMFLHIMKLLIGQKGLE